MRKLLPLAVLLLAAPCGFGQETPLRDDPGHPIPYVQNVDVFGEKKTGGTSWAVIIASPLRNDSYSMARFKAKLNGYLDAIASESYARKYGPPTLKTVDIQVVIDQRSDPIYFKLLDEMALVAAAKGVSLRVERR